MKDEDGDRLAWDASVSVLRRGATALLALILVGVPQSAVSFATRGGASNTPTYALMA